MSSANESLGLPVGGRRDDGDAVTRGGRFARFGDRILGSTGAKTDCREPPVNMLNMSSKVSSFAGDFGFRSGDGSTIFGGEGVGKVSIGADFTASGVPRASADSVSTSGCRSTANVRASVLLPTIPFAASTSPSSVTSRTHREAVSVNTHVVPLSPRRFSLGPSSFALFNNRAVSPSDPESETTSYIGISSSSTTAGGFGTARPPLRAFVGGGFAALSTLAGNRLARLFTAVIARECSAVRSTRRREESDYTRGAHERRRSRRRSARGARL